MRKVPCCDKQRQCNIWTSAVSMQGVKLISSSYFFREILRMSLLIAAESWFRLQITLDLSEFNGNVMTRNNGAHQCSPYDPGIQKWPCFFVQTPEYSSTSMKLSFASYIMSSIEVNKILGSGHIRKVISESLGNKENIGVLRCFRSWHWH